MSEDPIKKAYEDFLNSVNRGDNEFFDASTLVDIYDYAADNGDEFVRLEVLFRAARDYPNNEDLNMRRAWYYHDCNFPAGAKTVIGNTEIRPTGRGEGSRLNYLLKMTLTDLPQPKAIGHLKTILDMAPPMEDDEEIIRFLDVVSHYGLYAWAKREFSYLRSRCVYLNTLLYEMAQLAVENDDADYAVTLVEELTSLEPFNIDYWNYLAELDFSRKNLQKALSDAEFALAIDSSNVAARTFYAATLANLATDDNKAISLLADVISQQTPVDMECSYILCRALERQNRIDEGFDFFWPLFTADSANYRLAEILLKLAADHPQQLARVFDHIKAHAADFPVEDMMATMRNLFECRHFAIVADLIIALELPAEPYLAQALYREKRYGDILKHLDTASSFTTPPNSTSLSIVMALIRTGRREEALEAAKIIVSPGSHIHLWAFESMLVANALRRIVDALSADINAPSDDIDPFIADLSKGF